VVEKRDVERFDLNLEAYVLVDGASPDAQAQSLMTRDVSMNGAYLLTPTPLPLGTKVNVDVILSLEGLTPRETRKALIKASGAVLRTDSKGMAIRFDENSKFLPFAEDKLERK
jgi:hypothetical protein